MEKGFRKGVKQSTITQVDKKHGRMLVDLVGPRVVESLGRKR